MKNLTQYIFESLHDEGWLAKAKTKEEPFVKAALEIDGLEVKSGTLQQDFNGIDLIAQRDKTKPDEDGFYRPGGTFVIDVKGCDEKNKKSNKFLLTTKNDSGKEYPYKEDGYFAFIDYVDKTIVLAAQMDIKTLCGKYKEYDSKFSDKSKYVLLPKDAVKKLGRIIDPIDKLKNMI